MKHLKKAELLQHLRGRVRQLVNDDQHDGTLIMKLMAEVENVEKIEKIATALSDFDWEQSRR